MDETASADLPPAQAAAGTPSVDIVAPSPRLAENPEGITRPVRPCSLEELSAILESLPPTGVGLGYSALPTATHLDPLVKSGAIEDLLNGANGSVKNVRHSVPAIRPPSRDDASAPMRKENSLSSLLAVLASSALIAPVGWLLTVKSVPCLLSDLRQLAMPATTVCQHGGPQDHHH